MRTGLPKPVRKRNIVLNYTKDLIYYMSTCLLLRPKKNICGSGSILVKKYYAPTIIL